MSGIAAELEAELEQELEQEFEQELEQDLEHEQEGEHPLAVRHALREEYGQFVPCHDPGADPAARVERPQDRR